jgi:hypothetical protein
MGSPVFPVFPEGNRSIEKEFLKIALLDVLDIME